MKNYPYKASAIAHLTDARYFAAEGARWLGFTAPLPEDEQASARYARLGEMLSWIEGPEAVLEFPQPLSAEQAAEVVLATGVTRLQWPASSEVPAMPLLPPGVEWWPFFSLETFETKALREQLEAHSAFARYLVVRYTGPTESGVLSRLSEILQTLPVILELNWAPALLKDVLCCWDLAGLQFCGSEEERPGIKSFDELASLLELLEAEG